MPVTYVIGDVAGVVESPVYAILKMNKALRALGYREFRGAGEPLKIYNAVQPFTEEQPPSNGMANGKSPSKSSATWDWPSPPCCVLIYVLMVGWFRSFLTPIIVMAAIPFSWWASFRRMDCCGAFFTATSMIGFMAGAGIVVRNSIILVDFIELRLRGRNALGRSGCRCWGGPVPSDALDCNGGGGRRRVILVDPIFQGLAISLMAGEVASLLISRMAVPVLYFMAYNRQNRRTVASAGPQPVNHRS